MKSKLELANLGQRLVTKFCRANKIPLPVMVRPSPDHPEERLRRLYYTDSCGFYRWYKDLTKYGFPEAEGGVIHVMVQKCAACGCQGRQWSWPGYVIDRTPYGVFCHEFGHHVAFIYTGLDIALIREESNEHPLTGYCPNTDEWFAEMFRLFVTNPDLLKELRPKTYSFLRKGFKPVEKRKWQEVLEGCPARTLEQAYKKIVTVKKRSK